MVDDEGRRDDRRPVLIEQTAKKYKAWMLVGMVLVIMGCAGKSYFVGLGIMVFLLAKLCAWWDHG
jgi:hypothetical protein